MTSVLAALVPVFLLIAAGYGMRRSGFLPESFWDPAEKVTYYVFFPALLVISTAKADLAGLDILPMAGGLVAGFLLTSLLALALGRAVGSRGAALTSLVQGAIRPNTYVAIAAIAALHGKAGLALAAVCIVAVVPLANVVSVLVLLRHAASGPLGWRQVLLPLATNPLILACLAGGLLNATGTSLPGPLAATIEILGRASLPLGLLAVGAGLDFRAVHAARGPVALAGALKLAAIPALTWVACRALGAEGLEAAVATLYAAVPTAPNSYVLARRMGGDSPLIAGIITATTLAAAVSMPLVLMALRG